MTTKRLVYIAIVSVAVAFLSCEKEKIEYEKQYSGSFFNGFTYQGNFIIHDESISYYNADSNKVFSNLFEYQNGRKLGKSIHSLNFINNEESNYAIITVEGENLIEFVDKNFLSVKQIQLNKPRNISILRYSSGNIILVSFGDTKSGGMAIITPWDFSIVDTIETGNAAGEIFVHDYIYVLSNGDTYGDSTIARIYYGNNLFPSRKVEDIVIGKNPVSGFRFRESLTGYNDQSLLIYSKGSSIESSKIVTYNLIQNRVMSSSPFIADDVLTLETNSNDIIYNLNGKVYSCTFHDLNSPNLLTEHNIKSLDVVSFGNECLARDSENNCLYTGWVDYYLGISAEENGHQQYLYRFNKDHPNKEFFELIDSIPIGSNAKKIVGWP